MDVQHPYEDFYKVAKELGPLMGVAIVVAMFSGWSRVRNSYKTRTRGEFFIQLLISSITTAIIAIGTTLLLPVVLPESMLTYEIKLGITLYICVFGIKGLDMLARKKFGFSIVDTNDAQDVAKVLDNMPVEQRQACTQCVPKSEGSCPRE